jgi:thiol-disulfide isomerase/thioredoxin
VWIILKIVEVYFLKPVIFEITTLRKEKIKSVKFQRNFKIFETLLYKSEKLNTTIATKQEVVFGNRNAKLELVVITNPFCGHCRPIHENIEKILKKYNNEIKVVVRFSINTDNIKSDGVAITTRLLEIYDKQNKDEALNAINDIYNGMETVLWLKKWGNCNEKEKQLDVLKEERDWCTDNKINFTPEILINGYSFPKEYQKSDLKYFIEDLLETI